MSQEPEIDEADSNNGESDEKIVALNIKGNRLGIAYSDLSSKRLVYLDDLKTLNVCGEDGQSDAVHIIRTVLMEVGPSRVLIPAQFDSDLITYLEQDAELMVYRLAPRPTHEFSHRTSQRLLQQLVESVDGLTYDNGCFIRVPEVKVTHDTHVEENTELNTFSVALLGEAQASTGALCALLLFMQRSLGGEFEHGVDRAIASIERVSLANTMLISKNTLDALHVFDDSCAIGPGGTVKKDASSLYSILNFTCTKLGGQLLASWLLRPSTSVQEISRRQESVEVLMTANLRKISAHLSRVKNVYGALSEMSFSTASLANWKTLLHFLAALRGMQEFLPSMRLKDNFTDPEKIEIIDCLHELIYEVIDFDLSTAENRVVLKPLVDPDLDELKSRYANIESMLKQESDALTAHLPREIKQAVSIIYFPQVGYLICSKNDGVGEPMYCEREWTLSFTTSTHSYFRSDAMSAMDESYGDIFGLICDREIEILQIVQQQVLTHVRLLQQMASSCAELDCLLSLAQAALNYNYCKPELTDDSVLELRGARHPLLEFSVENFMENAVNVDAAKPVVMMTGANFSGKTTYMTQCGLICIMAQIGSFVPASSAKVGIIDKILVRLMTSDSVSKLQSSFLIDLNQISSIIRSMTPKSLLLIDEFGKGASSTDGASLFAAMVNYLLSLEQCPRVFLSTHFHSLFENNILEDDRIRNHHMEIQLSDDQKDITFLYELKDGRANASFGVCCARFCGMLESITDRAQVIAEHMAKEGDLFTLMTPTTQEVSNIESASRLVKHFLQADLTSISTVETMIERVLSFV